MVDLVELHRPKMSQINLFLPCLVCFQDFQWSFLLWWEGRLAARHWDPSACYPEETRTLTVHNKLVSFAKRLDTIIHLLYAVSHKDWELTNSRIWLAEIDVDRGLDFPI